MAPGASFAPVARPRLTASAFVPALGRGRTVIAEAVSVAFAIRDDAAALRAHALDVTTMRWAR